MAVLRNRLDNITQVKNYGYVGGKPECGAHVPRAILYAWLFLFNAIETNPGNARKLLECGGLRAFLGSYKVMKILTCLRVGQKLPHLKEDPKIS